MVLYVLLDQRVQRKIHQELVFYMKSTNYMKFMLCLIRVISKFKCCIKDMLCIEKGLKTEAVGKDPICWLKENQIKLVDRPRLPYLNAVINVLKSTAL